jgi:putative DNA primase/helicase
MSLKLVPKKTLDGNANSADESQSTSTPSNLAQEAVPSPGNDNTGPAASAPEDADTPSDDDAAADAVEDTGEPVDEAKALPGIVDTAPCGVDQIDADEVTEDTVAESFVTRNHDHIRYDHDRKSWFRWKKEGRWKEDKTGGVPDAVRRHARDRRKGNRAMSRHQAVKGMEMMARNDQRIAVISDIWDTNPMLLGTPGGTVDLTTGELIEADPEHYITKSTKVAPAPKGTPCPHFMKFMHEVTGGDTSFERFIQQYSGYCLTGDTTEQVLLFIHGNGGNGKGMLLNTIADIMGDYPEVAARETFSSSRHQRHLTEIAMLEGARLICVSETEKGQVWNQERINEFTGGDRVTANRMRQDMRTFKPVGKLLIVGNHKPAFQSVNDAVKRRFLLAPFNFKPTTVDKHLEANLKKEYPAILRWMIDGCLDWLANGLVVPDIVKKATAAYFDGEDIFGRWIEEKCERGATLKATASILFDAWVEFAIANGVKPGSKQAFSENLSNRGIEKTKSSNMVYLGIALKLISTLNFGVADL